jgi:hypothetical protein
MFIHSLSTKSLLWQYLIPRSHSTGLLKTLEIRTFVIEDMKSKGEITTAYQLISFASSTLLVKCSSATSRVSIIAVYIPDDLSMTPYRYRTNERPGSRGQTSLVAAKGQSVRFAPSLVTRFDTGQPHFLTCVCPLMLVARETRVGAGRCHAELALASRALVLHSTFQR